MWMEMTSRILVRLGGWGGGEKAAGWKQGELREWGGTGGENDDEDNRVGRDVEITREGDDAPAPFRGSSSS